MFLCLHTTTQTTALSAWVAEMNPHSHGAPAPPRASDNVCHYQVCKNISVMSVDKSSAHPRCPYTFKTHPPSRLPPVTYLLCSWWYLVSAPVIASKSLTLARWQLHRQNARFPNVSKWYPINPLLFSARATSILPPPSDRTTLHPPTATNPAAPSG